MGANVFVGSELLTRSRLLLTELERGDWNGLGGHLRICIGYGRPPAVSAE